MTMEPIKIYVEDLEGVVHEVEGLEGWRIMEVIRDNGLPIKAECGGCCACATCHVYIDPTWISKVIPPQDEEISMLDEAFFVENNSRLSCQILLTKELEGIKLKIAPNSD